MAKKRILLVEDDPSTLNMTMLRLQHEGYEVIQTTDGKAAVEEAERQLPIHLVLLDVKLPQMNGYEVCRALKRQPATAAIPVIVFTASERQLQTLADRCLEIGAADWLKKPFRSDELMAKIHRALKEEGLPHG